MTQPQRLVVPGLRNLIFLRYPVEVAPPDGTIGSVEGQGFRWVGTFKGGQWTAGGGRPFKSEPTHWTLMNKDLR